MPRPRRAAAKQVWPRQPRLAGKCFVVTALGLACVGTQAARAAVRGFTQPRLTRSTAPEGGAVACAQLVPGRIVGGDASGNTEAVARRALLGALGLPAVLAPRAGFCSTAQGGRQSAELCDDPCLLSILENFEATDRKVERDIFMSTDANTIAYTYGTIRPPAIRSILAHLNIDEADVLTDVGSGCGNVVLQVFANTPIRKVRGIEFVKARHVDAVRHFEDFKKQYQVDPSKEMLLVNGDACIEDFSDSTIVFASSTCFPEALMACLKERCESNRKLKYLISQKPLGPSKLKYLGDLVDMKTSWSPGEPYRIYTNVPGTKLTTQDGVKMGQP